MAGTLVISTLSDGTNSTSSTNCIQGSAKAWVNFNGIPTVSIRKAYNVSSITRNGTGDYSVNFTNAISDANGCVLATGTHDNGSYTGIAYVDNDNTPLTTSRARINFLGTGNSFIDVSYGMCAVFD